MIDKDQMARDVQALLTALVVEDEAAVRYVLKVADTEALALTFAGAFVGLLRETYPDYDVTRMVRYLGLGLDEDEEG
jgi:hypothetical protein